MNKKTYFTLLAAWFWALSLGADPCSEEAQRLLHQSMPPLTPLQYANFLLHEDRKLPGGLFASSWDDIFELNTVQQQRKLMHELGELSEFHRLARGRRELLTLKIVESEEGGVVVRQIVDEDFLRRWGIELHDHLILHHNLDDSTNISVSLLQKMVEILERPSALVSPASLAQNLAATIKNLTPQLRVTIADEMEKGKMRSLVTLLPEDLPGNGFEPSRLGLKEGESRDYYLNLLEESLEIDRKLDVLLPSYFLFRRAPTGTHFTDFLGSINEGHLEMIKDIRFKRKYIGEIVSASKKSQSKFLRKSLEGRITRIGKYLSGHKKNVVEKIEANAQLTLTEVHPYLGIFRGHLGGDCATKHCFGFANSPLERVFFVANKRGESIGYVNTTIVSLTDGSRALFVNTIAGARVSGTSTEKILLGLSKAKDALGVREVVLLGRNKTTDTITHPIIRDAYNQLRGEPVKVVFGDKNIRREVAKKVLAKKYDMPDFLEDANKLALPERHVSVQVEKRAFSVDVPTAKQLELPDDINEETALSLFRFLLQNKGSVRELEKLLPYLPLKLNAKLASKIFQHALTMGADAPYITTILNRLPEKLDSASASEMFKHALQSRADSPYAEKILDHLPDNLTGPAAFKMFKFALTYARRRIDKIMQHLPERLDNRQAFQIFAIALEHRLDSRYLDTIVDHFPRSLSDFYAGELISVILQAQVNAKYIEKIMHHLPDTLDTNDVSKMLSNAFEYGAEAKYITAILNRLPEQVSFEFTFSMISSALKNKAHVQWVENLLGRLPAALDSSSASQIFEKAMIYRLGPEYFDSITKHIREQRKDTLDHLHARMRRLQDSDYKNLLLEWVVKTSR